MSKVIVLPSILLLIFISGCENMNTVKEIDDVLSHNDLNLELKIDGDNEFSIEKLMDNESPGTSYLRIKVENKFAMRGKVDINPEKNYKLSITLKNDDSDPIITYSYWKGLVTSVRNYTVAGKNGNPPISKTQDFTQEWMTYEVEIQAKQDEDAFMLSLLSNKGVFYIKDISMEEI